MTEPYGPGETRETRRRAREKETREWVDLASAGWTQAEIADLYGVGRATVSGRIRSHRQEHDHADA